MSHSGDERSAPGPRIRYRQVRKCHTCGYLVLGDGDVCKHCGAGLPRVMAAALVAGGVAAGAPVSVPAIPAPAPRYASPVAPPASLIAPTLQVGAPPLSPPPVGRVPIARDYWSPTPPAVSTKRTRTTPRALLALVAIASMALGWIAVDHVLHGDGLPAGTSEFVAGHGVAYSSPDHTLDARLPATPTVQRQPIAVGSASATLNIAQVQTDDYEVVAASMVLPVSLPAGQVDVVLHDILNEAAAAQDAEIMSEEHVTRDGVPGIEVRATVKDGYDARIMVLSSGSHIYMLGVHAKHGTARLYDALVASLVTF